MPRYRHIIRNRLATTLAREIAARSFTLEQAATFAGVSSRTLIRTLGGHTIPREGTLEKLATAFELDLDEIVKLRDAGKRSRYRRLAKANGQ